MPRRKRMNLPGVAFHVTVRLQGGEHLFEGIEQSIENRLLDAACMYRVRILAWAVMSNHLHIVVIQGDAPLGEYMQALGRRIARVVQRRTGRCGHVLQAPYFAAPSLDAEHLRNVITYVHLNPVRAQICDDPADFRWSSHRAYLTCDRRAWQETAHLAYAAGLRLFANEVDCILEECTPSYLNFLRYRRDIDALLEPVVSPLLKPRLYPSPSCPGGDRHWLSEFATAADTAQEVVAGMPVPLPDISTIARRVVGESDADAILEDIRYGCRSTGMVELRHAIIAQCLLAGYRTGQIAGYLRTASSTVSRVAVAMRSAHRPIQLS